MENNAQLLKGVLEYCVLKLIAQEPTYGYEIVMHLKQVGFSDLSESTLYPLLLRLEQQGKVTVLSFGRIGASSASWWKKFLRRSQMNKYFVLRKTNRMRTELLTEKSQEQLKEVIRYLRRVSWDFCGIELVRSDLLDIAIQANKENQELFHSISDAKTFVEEVKPSLKTLRAGDYFWYVAPLYFFFGWGVEGLLLYPVIGNWVFELSVGYLMQLVVAVAAFCVLFRRMMEQVGFPPRENWLKYAAWLVLYIVILYGTGWFFTQIAGKIVLLRLPILSYSVFCLLLGAGLYAVHFWRYGKDSRLSARI